MKLDFDAKAALELLEKRLLNPPEIKAQPEISVKAQVESIKLVVNKELEPLKSRLDTIEIKTLIPLKNGEKGEKGDKGDKGDAGLNGLDGRTGKDGKNGIDGKDGSNGVSVVDAEIAVDDHLVLKLSDGKIIDAGEMPTADKVNGMLATIHERPQVTVSSTAPPNPQLNDLWLQI
jgi:hypothetical protein